MALLIALALMTGLQGELRDRIVGSSAHIFVFKVGAGIENFEEDIAKLKQVPRVTGAAPAILGQGIIIGPTQNGYVTIKGIIPALEAEVTDIEKAIQSGSLDALNPVEGRPPGIVIGRELANKLGTFVGDDVQLMTPEGGVLSPFGDGADAAALSGGRALQPRPVRVRSGLRLRASERRQAVDRPEYAEPDRTAGRRHVRRRRDRRLDPRDSWARSTCRRTGRISTSRSSARSALEKLAISVTIGLIVMVAALNIVASLVLLVMEKSRDIAILKTMGSSAASIRRIFMLQGLVIGLIGTTAGAVAGWAVIYVADRYKLVSVPLDVYQISHVPFRLEFLDFVTVIISAIVICFIATIYPSRQAAKLDPAQALRYQ